MQQLSSTTHEQTPITRPRYDFLKNEIARWQEANILNRAQGDEIIARYSVEGGPQHGLLALLIAGVCVVGGSLMLFISSNWQGVNIQIKGMAVLSVMLACYISAWHLKGKSPFKSILCEALVFLGSVFFGGATVLISQHFQVTGNQPELLLWAMGIAPFTILFRSHASAILCSGVIVYATLRPFGGAGMYSADWLPVLCAFGALYLAYFTRSQVALAITLCALAAGACRTAHDLAYFLLIFFGISCFIMHLWHEHSKRWQIMSTPYLLVSFAFVLLPMLMLVGQYSSYSDADAISKIQIAAIATLILLATLIKSPAGKTRWPFAVGLLVIGAVILSCLTFNGTHKMLTTLSAFFLANLFYLFYITSSIENRLIQFLPVATFTIFTISFIATAPGGAMLGSGIAFGVGLVLMICSFAALRKSMRIGSERSLN